MPEKPILTLVTYQARSGCEDELRGVLRTHVARLRELGLIADRPHFAAAHADKPGAFVESFWWANAGAAAQAHDNSEVQEMWMRVEDFCTPGGIVQSQLDPLD